MEDNERIFPDDKLVSMFRNGDSHAFEILLSRYDECIMRAIRKSTINNNDSVEDLYQEISEQTGINRSTVVKRLKSAYQELEKRMIAKGYDDALI